MAIFNAFNKLNNEIGERYSEVRSVTQGVNEYSSNVRRVVGQAEDFINGNNIASRIPGDVGESIRQVRDTVSYIGDAVGLGSDSVGNVGTSIRMSQNAIQGVTTGAAPQRNPISSATYVADTAMDSVQDWRVSISVPSSILAGNVIAPLANGNGYPRMIFPLTPSVLIGHTANYSQITPTHTNYPYQAYENSQVNEYTIVGEFANETAADGEYWIACLHFLRTVTKMFYGESNNVGNPPPICRLNGYGQHVLNNIPVVITGFNFDMPTDVDYLQCSVDGKQNFVPTKVTMSVNCAPTYSRRSQARFSLQDFAAGKHVGGSEGFV